MPKDNRRLALWCLLASISVAICVWALIGSPELHTSGSPLAPARLAHQAK